MTYKIKIEQFEGPLDLLLQLIEQEELDITQVSLAKVTEQYLQYINESSEIRTEELADFLVVAAKLLLIKSRHLLPELVEDEDEEGIDLEYQLKMYKEFYEASKVLDTMIAKKKFLYPRQKMIIKVDNIFNPPQTLTTDKMRDLFSAVLQDLSVWVSLPQETIARTMSIRERIEGIHAMIKQRAEIKFGELLHGSKNKAEVIVTFLAVLELVKQRTIAVVQDGIFDEIKVKRTGIDPESIIE